MTAETAPTARRGPLVLADISGYTAFLQAVSVAHGEEMAESGAVPEAYPLMTTLLDGIVDRLVPPFVLSKTEGDAVFAFAAGGDFSLRGDAVLACVDACYAAFQDEIEALEAALTCGCSACSLGIKLDLKFVMHYGGYVVQPIAGRPELLGPDVNVVHRLLKNHANSLVEGAYALFTKAAVEQLDVPLSAALPLSEDYDQLPPIDTFVFSVPLVPSV